MPILIKGSGGAQKTPTFNTNNLASSGKIVATAGNKSATLTLGSNYDSDFMSSNIVSGKTIFGVTGTAVKVATGTISGSGESAITLPVTGGSKVVSLTISCSVDGVYTEADSIATAFFTPNGEDICACYDEDKGSFRIRSGYGDGVSFVANGCVVDIDSSRGIFPEEVTYEYVLVYR